MAANESASVLFLDDLTADKQSRMNAEVYKAILPVQIQPNAAELVMILHWPSQALDLNLLMKKTHILSASLQI